MAEESLHEESFGGGMVLAKDHTKLAPGELGVSTNCYYLFTTDGLNDPPSRTALGVVSSGATVTGLQGFSVQGIGTRLVAEAATALWVGDPSGSNPFASFQTLSADGTNVAVIQRNTTLAYALCGVDKNFAFYDSAPNSGHALAIRRMGMQAVDSPPTLGTDGTKNFSLYDASVTPDPSIGSWDYWTTELWKFPDGTFVESTNGKANSIDHSASGAIATVTLTTGLNTAPIVTRPSAINIPTPTGATMFWRVYRGKRADAKTPAWPIGILVSTDLSMTQTTWTDTIDTTSQTGAVSGTTNPSVPNTSLGTYVTDAGWSTPANGFVIDGATSAITVATTTAGGPVFGGGNFYTGQAIYTMGTFNFTTISGAINGIQVVVKCSSSQITNAWVTVQISGTDGGPIFAGPYAKKVATITSASLTNYTLGGNQDTWSPGGAPWSTDSFTNTNFRVALIFAFTSPTLGATNTFTLDGATVNVFFGGSTNTGNSQTVPFPAVQITNELGTTLSCGANAPPPISTIGDLYSEQTVLNDVNTANLVQYSIAGSPEYFPPLYYVVMPLRSGDRVTCIKTLGRVLLVGATFGFWRLNYLPTELDVSIDRGRMMDITDPTAGPVSETAFCTFRGNDGRVLLAYATKYDLRATDGYTSWPLADDFPYKDEVDSTQTVQLINNPENWELILYFVPKGGGQIQRVVGWSNAAVRINYHPSHFKGATQFSWPPAPRFKVSGVIACSNKISATEATVSAATYFNSGLGSIWTAFRGNATSGGGSVYYDTDLANANYPTTDNFSTIRSRFMFLNGFGKEWGCKEIYLHHNDPTNVTANVFSLTPTSVKTNDGYTTQPTKTVTAINAGAGGVLQRYEFFQNNEGLKLQLVGSANAQFSLNKYVIRGEDFGREESGK